MPVVPTLEQPSVQQEPLPGRAYPRIVDNVPEAAFGEAIARGAETIANVGAAEEIKQKNQNDALRVIDANTQLEAARTQLLYGSVNPQTGQREGGAFSLRGQDAINVPQKVLPQFQEAADKISSTLTPDQQRLFHSHIASNQNELNLQLNRYEFEESNRMAQQIYASGSKQAIENAVLGWRDPQVIDKSRADIKALAQLQGHREGWTDTQIDQASKLYTDELNRGVALSRSLDPTSARSVLTEAKNEQSADPIISQLTPLEREQLYDRAKTTVSKQMADGVVQTYRNLGPQSGSRAYAQIDTSGLPNDVNDEARGHVQQGLEKLQAERSRQYANDLTTLESSVNAGQPVPNARSLAATLYNNSAIGQEHYASILGSIDRIQKKQDDEFAGIKAVEDAYKNRTPLDPHDKEIRDDVDAYAQAATRGMKPGSPQYTNQMADIAARTGVVPPSALNWARAQLVSADPDAAATAADLYSRMQEASPRGLPYSTDAREIAIASSIDRAIKAGSDAETAVTMARHNSELNKDDTMRLDQKWKAMQSDKNSETLLRTELKKNLPAGFLGIHYVQDIPAAMVGEFNDLNHRYFMYTGGDVEQARKLATQDLLHVWGQSEVNGKKELMKYPPELTSGLTAQMVRDDISKEVTPLGLDASKVRLVPTPETARTNGQIWALGVPGKSGAYDVVRGTDQRPLPYQLPGAREKYDEVRKKAAQEGMARAKDEQESRRAYSESSAEYPAVIQ